MPGAATPSTMPGLPSGRTSSCAARARSTWRPWTGWRPSMPTCAPPWPGRWKPQALAYFWYRHGYATEGRRWLERAIELTAEDGGAPLGQLTHWLGVLLQQQGEMQDALSLLERSLAIWRDLGDRDQKARELNSLGITHHFLGDLDTARALLEDSAAICREIGSNFRL